MVWEALPPSWVTLNIDGASKGNSGPAGGGGGVIRGHRGEWICGFVENMGICTSTKAELKAVLRGLLIAKERSLTKVLVRLDSLWVTNMLRNEVPCNTEHAPLIAQCRRLTNMPDWEVSISHCY